MGERDTVTPGGRNMLYAPLVPRLGTVLDAIQLEIFRLICPSDIFGGGSGLDNDKGVKSSYSYIVLG